jgi:hypothetical protein
MTTPCNPICRGKRKSRRNVKNYVSLLACTTYTSKRECVSCRVGALTNCLSPQLARLGWSCIKRHVLRQSNWRGLPKDACLSLLRWGSWRIHEGRGIRHLEPRRFARPDWDCCFASFQAPDEDTKERQSNKPISLLSTTGAAGFDCVPAISGPRCGPSPWWDCADLARMPCTP